MRLGEDVKVLGYGSRDVEHPLEKRDVVIVHVSNLAERYLTEDGSIRGAAFMTDYIRRAAGAVILTFDDDYTSLRFIQRLDDQAGYRIFLEDLVGAIKLADGVIVATDQLVDVYSRWATRIGVARNYFPSRLLDMPMPGRRSYDVGYIGYLGTVFDPKPHREDLLEVAGSLRGRRVWTIGSPQEFATLVPGAKVKGTGPLPQEIFQRGVPPLYTEIGRARVGIAPLVEHEFNRSKSWIKPLEYAISGTPCAVPAWHPAYSSLDLPLFSYDQPDGLGGTLDHVLGLERTEYLKLVRESRRAVQGYTLEKRGGEEWLRTLRLMI
jgi:hypothetical protein